MSKLFTIHKFLESNGISYEWPNSDIFYSLLLNSCEYEYYLEYVTYSYILPWFLHV